MGAIKLEAKVLVRCRLTIIDYDNFLEILSGLVRPGIPVPRSDPRSASATLPTCNRRMTRLIRMGVAE